MSEPIKSKHAAILNRLAEMQEAAYYATARTELGDAERAILQLERELAQERQWRESSDCHGLDAPERVCFYEQDFYVLSNFSSFAIDWQGGHFPTSEHAYHWEKFTHDPAISGRIKFARSAHEAFKIAEANKQFRRPDWDDVKLGIMQAILLAKVRQHEYVRRKLLATGDRELVENSWRDDFWGWGPNKNGQNMLGKLWMEIRAELRATPPTPTKEEALS